MFNRLRRKVKRPHPEDDEKKLEPRLHNAVMSGSLSDVNAIVEQSGDDALVMNTAHQCHHDHTTDCKNHTPLMAAVFMKRSDLIQALGLASQLDANATDKTGKTALHHAVIYCPTMIPDILKLTGVDINAVDLEKRTPLHYAILRRNPHEECVPKYVTYLMESSDIDVEKADALGQTPLMLAVHRGDAMMIGLLHDAGARSAVTLTK